MITQTIEVGPLLEPGSIAETEMLYEAIEIGEGRLFAPPIFAHIAALCRALENANLIINELHNSGCSRCGCRESEPYDFVDSETGYQDVGTRCNNCGQTES